MIVFPGSDVAAFDERIQVQRGKNFAPLRPGI
jgi:hypothetical protein